MAQASRLVGGRMPAHQLFIVYGWAKAHEDCPQSYPSCKNNLYRCVGRTLRPASFNTSRVWATVLLPTEFGHRLGRGPAHLGVPAPGQERGQGLR